MLLPDNSKPVVVASHRRSGTHLTIDLLRRQFAECASWKWPGERNDRLYCNIDELNGKFGSLSEAIACRILRRVARPLVKTHSWPGLQKGFLSNHTGLHQPDWLSYFNQQASWIYVYRDPRPVMCSYYLFCIGAKIIESSTSISSFIRQEDDHGRSRIELWSEHIKQWTAEKNVLCINYDNIIRDTPVVLEAISNHLGVTPLYRKPLLPAPLPHRRASRLARLFGVKPESTAIINKTKLQWRTAFNADDLTFINKITFDLRQLF